MQPFPSPLDPLPAVADNAARIKSAEDRVRSVLVEQDSGVEASIAAAFALVGEVAKDQMAATKRQVAKINRLISKVQKAIEPQVVPEETTRDPAPLPFPQPIPPIGIVPQPIPPPPPLPYPCPPCDGGGGGEPIDGIIIIEPPIEVKPPDDWPCDPCKPPPPVVCPPCEPAPPPPEPECCPTQVIKVLCGDGLVLGKLSPCTDDPCAEEDPFLPPPPLYPEQPQGFKDPAAGGCVSQVCPILSGKETVQVVTLAPFPIGKSGKTSLLSDCGKAKLLEVWSGEVDVDRYLGYDSPEGFSSAIWAGIEGARFPVIQSIKLRELAPEIAVYPP